MKNLRYLPSTDAGKSVWTNNFDTKLPLYATTLGLSSADIQSVHDDNAAFQYIIAMTQVYRQSLANLITYKNMLKSASGTQHIGPIPSLPVLPTPPTTVPEGIFDRITKLVTRIKNSTGYSDAIGADLGIIAPSVQDMDESTLQPDLNVRVELGRPRLKWVKAPADATDLYVDRNDGNGFVFLTRSVKSEYIDTTVLAATKVFDEWKYKAVYVIDDLQVGVFSKVTSVDVKKI
jgi:hypothetical protein